MPLVATNFLTFIANVHMMGRKCCRNARKLMSWFVDIFYLGWNDAKNRKNILSCERESTKIRILVTHPNESWSRYMISVIWSHSLFHLIQILDPYYSCKYWCYIYQIDIVPLISATAVPNLWATCWAGFELRLFLLHLPTNWSTGIRFRYLMALTDITAQIRAKQPQRRHEQRRWP